MRQRRARRYGEAAAAAATAPRGSGSSGGGAGGGGRVRPRLSEAERSRLGERRGAGVAQAGRRAEARRPLPPFVWPPRGGSAARPRSSSATAGPAPSPRAPKPLRLLPSPSPVPTSRGDPGPGCGPLGVAVPQRRPGPGVSLGSSPLRRAVPSRQRAELAAVTAEAGASGARPEGRERVLPGGGGRVGGSAGRGGGVVLSGREGAGWPGARKGVFLCLLPTITPHKLSRVRAGCRRGPALGDGLGELRVLPLCFLPQCR